ncbi:PstS family phosphate ABC transporter substrate-binding protein [Oscillatoria salina]|uniref:PstS family phosphate ABC transporter substrate-binding protein n=1 Tax=Oscillatoria salina TaxID=331517 RepID=UPI0013BD347E|nr:PstS family phosphate ABC transporter substrate-binding protein [Oscillatoria salina]MBZ8181958.1 PstS family phosphate ABC transporter substrate-binding protein [Oscillatoria salina IIICB1]NET89144.1 PstS family phosphate ABC transporter substrate-binding protein [Kamptonema sp. SIO1D9]
MKNITKKVCKRLSVAGWSVIAITAISACAQIEPEQQESIKVDGSSTVYPITLAIASEFTSEVEVNFSGTGGGFEKFCTGETAINNASRPIQTAEMEACDRAGIRYMELPIAFDALTIVVNPENDWLESITIAELAKIWQPEAEGKITNWNQIRTDFPDRPLTLYGPGTDSGTYEYFTEAVVGESGASRSDYVASEDDEVLVQGVSQDPNALGYFGYAYYEANRDNLKAVAVANNNAAILPSPETLKNAEYQPLSRPLFIYVNAAAAQKNPALQEFVEFYLEKAPETVSSVGYVPLPSEGYNLAMIQFEKGKVGTVFEGKSEFNLTIEELLKKQAKF